MNDMSNPPVMSVSLTMTPELAQQLQRDTGALGVAQAYEITTADDASLVKGELDNVKGRIKKLKELKAGFVAPAKQIIANAEALFDPAIDANVLAEAHHKGLLMDFTKREEARIAELRRVQEEADRKARQEAEAKAAGERARAEEQARAAREAAAKAEQERLKAEAEGNTRHAAAMAAEAAKQNEKAQAAIENGEAKAQEATLLASASVTPIMSASKIAGFSTRKNWSAEFQHTETDAIKAIANALPARPELISLLKIDMTAANKMAKALEDNFNIPGLVAKNNPVAASRA